MTGFVCWLAIVALVVPLFEANAQLQESDKQLEVDKSFEIFKYSNLLKQRTWFKLKCEFTVASQNTTEYKIRWFKLSSRKNLTVLTEFVTLFESQKAAAQDVATSNQFANVFVSDLESSGVGRAAANLTRLRSSLLFLFKNPNDVNKAHGLYVCKPDGANQTSVVETIQEINVNEMINQNEMIFKLNYTVLQVTSSRLVIEIKQLKTFNQQINANSRLIYSLSQLSSNSPVVRGGIDMTSSHSNKFFLAIESLQPNTTYLLTVYLRTYLNTDTNYVQLVANRTLTTLVRVSTVNSTARASNEEADEDDDDYESDDYEDLTETVDETSSKSVITCDVLKKPNSDRNSNSAHVSLFNPQSLFSASKTSKPKSNMITINFSENNLHKLVQSSLNTSAVGNWPLQHHHQHLKHFKDLFDLNKFNKDVFDYSTFFHCRKQLEQTGFKTSEPMCLLNLESTPSNVDLDYDYYDSSSVQADDHFSVQTSFEQQIDRARSTASFYLASACHRRKRPIRNSNQFGSLSKEAMIGLGSNQKIKYQVRLNENRITDPMTTSTPVPTQKTADLLNSIKKQHIAQLTNINKCQLVNEDEIQFQIESKLTDSMSNHRTSLNRLGFYNNTPYYYHIEILVPSVANRNSKPIFKPKFRALSRSPAWLAFKFKIEPNSNQIVRVNLTKSGGENLEEDEAAADELNEDEYIYETSRVRKLSGDLSVNETASGPISQVSNLTSVGIATSLVHSRNESDEKSGGGETTVTTFAEPLFALNHHALAASLPPLADYVFKIRILTEDNIQLSEFELNVSCKRMSSTNVIGNGINDGNNSFVGLIMTCICAIVIIIVGSVFCLFIKKKYGLSPDYFLNLKNNILLRSSNGRAHHHAHHHHGNHHLGKRAKNANNNANNLYQHQIQQYQLDTKPNPNLLNINNHPAFNYNYVRILKQKWHNTSNDVSNQQDCMDGSTLGTRTRDIVRRMKNYLSLSANRSNLEGEENKLGSRSGSSSASSSPLVIFSAANKRGDPIDEAAASPNSNPFYSTVFTNSIRNKLNGLKTLNYKEDHDSISLDLFESYVQKMHVDGDFGFAQLYEEITAFTKSYSYTSDVALLDSNRCKNRYSNILTYDHSRVKLACDERDESGGYINANYVDGYQKPNAYIATQGPMPNTFGDFWRMIWEKNCSIIVMITNVKEKGRIKCDQYWPEDGVDCYSNIQVTHLHTIMLAFYTKRIFTIKLKASKKRCNSERLVYQYHFTDWPDHGVPYYILPVLSFIKKSSRSNPELGGPIVVHCSAGVGRTGTYIVIDAMLRQAQIKATLNIHTFLKHIRHQRNYLVQTEEQFIFIYDALLEAIKSGETELHEHNYKSYLDRLALTGPAANGGAPVGAVREGEMLIDRQFELICEFKPNEYQVSIALLPFNLEKNRNTKIIPVNNSRVILSKDPTIDGSEYINASFLHGCNRQDEFIVTQYPLRSTQCSFWQMVWDNNSSQIVCLQSEETESCEPYWLPVGEIMKCGESFTVQLREENFDMDFVLRDFLLQSIDEDYEFNCRMITACYWPDSCTPIKSAFELINKVKMFRLQNLSVQSNVFINSSMANLPPIIVHDLCGSFRAGTFCALYALQDLVHLEASVNVYEIAKMFHLKRPGIWTHKSNIMFLYEAVEYLFDEMHSNSNYQFRNYLNLNIDNHFNNFMYSSNHYYNQTGQLQSTTSTDHVSLNLIPQHSKPSQSKSASNTLTLPNNLTHTTSFNLPVITQPGQQLRINETVGSRLHNSFQDAMTTMPLTSAKISMDPQNLTKTSFIDLPRSMIPSFFDPKPSQARRSTSANYRTSKALKFMNTMRIKSVSFKRALFRGSSGMTTMEKQQTIGGASQTIQLQSAPPQPAHSIQIDPTGRMETASSQHPDGDEQKPSIIISISSGSSSATTSSSSTALSSTPITTATESMSFKSAFVGHNPNQVNSNNNKLSREKLN